MNDWFSITEESQCVAVSTRVRFARNLKDYPFPARMSAAQKQALCEKVQGCLLDRNSYIAEQFYAVHVQGLCQNELLSLMEQNLISLEFINDPVGKGLILSKDGKSAILIGEEDHIRIQVIADSLAEAFDTADKIDLILGETLSMAYDSRLGYLTQCPTNLGTAMRASVMLHLPALGETGAMGRISANLTKLGITVRGTHGEGTQVQGHLYQISNQITLGLSEKEAVENLSSIVGQILAEELTARKEWGRSIAQRDRVYRAFGALKYTESLSAKELQELCSLVQLGIGLGMLTGVSCKALRAFCSTLQSGTLTLSSGAASAAARDMARAKAMREFLLNAQRTQ